MGQRRTFSLEFKLEAVKLIRDRTSEARTDSGRRDGEIRIVSPQ